MIHPILDEFAGDTPADEDSAFVCPVCNEWQPCEGAIHLVQGYVCFQCAGDAQQCRVCERGDILDDSQRCTECVSNNKQLAF